jgi:hypothetical protein
VTSNQFRSLALALPSVEERSHMAHPDFRVRNRIFATLGYPDAKWAMVKLTPADQAELLLIAPEVFRPAPGAWGRSGSTLVLLSSAKVAQMRRILRQAYEGVSVRG